MPRLHVLSLFFHPREMLAQVPRSHLLWTTHGMGTTCLPLRFLGGETGTGWQT
jgi:hypothetical protein